MRPILYWLATGFLIFTGYKMLGGHYENFWQPNAFMMTIVPTVCFFVYAYGIQGFFKFGNRLFTAKTTDTDFDIIDTGTSMSYLFGAITCILGFAYAMENGSNPGAVGMGIGNAFYGLFYGVIPAVLFMPLKHHKVFKGAKKSHLRSLGYSAATVALVVTAYFMTMYVTKH